MRRKKLTRLLLAAQAKDKTLLITKVERRSFADAGGVVPGDRVSSVGGIDVYTIADLKAALTECRDRGGA